MRCERAIHEIVFLKTIYQAVIEDMETDFHPAVSLKFERRKKHVQPVFHPGFLLFEAGAFLFPVRIRPHVLQLFLDRPQILEKGQSFHLRVVIDQHVREFLECFRR